MVEVKMYKDDIQRRIELLDDRVNLEHEGDGRFQIVIVGGGALVLGDYIARSTNDIDVLGTDKRLFDLLLLFNINDRSNTYLFSFLYNYEDRIKHIWSGKKIDYYTASFEDIVISKICASRGKDVEDLDIIAPHVNWDLLNELINNEDEMRLITMSDRGYLDFKACYEIFEGRHRPCKD